MRKLKYWVAPNVNTPSYSVRCRTRQEVLDRLKDPDTDPADFSKVIKVTVEYQSAFDLLCKCLGEGGIYEPEIDEADKEEEASR